MVIDSNVDMGTAQANAMSLVVSLDTISQLNMEQITMSKKIVSAKQANVTNGKNAIAAKTSTSAKTQTTKPTPTPTPTNVARRIQMLALGCFKPSNNMGKIALQLLTAKKPISVEALAKQYSDVAISNRLSALFHRKFKSALLPAWVDGGKAIECKLTPQAIKLGFDKKPIQAINMIDHSQSD